MAATHRWHPARLGDGRVELEPLTVEHVDALEAAASDRSTFGLAPVPLGRDGARLYVEDAVAERDAGKSVPYAVRRARSGSIVGSIRFMSLEWWRWPRGPIHVEGEPRSSERGDPPDVVEIGHAWLAPSAQGTEVFTACCDLMMTHAFDRWNVHRVTLKTDARNERSRAAIARVGGVFEGVLRAHLPAADGIVRDTAMFSVVRAEWPAVRARLAALASEDQAGGAT